MAFPLLVRALRLSLEAVDPRLEAAASTLGAGRWRVFATITLPLTLPGLLTGTVLAFAGALGIRCHHHLRLEHSWRDSHLAVGALFVDPDPWWRGGGGATLCLVGRDRDGLTGGLGMAGQTCAGTAPGEGRMSHAGGLILNVQHRLGQFSLEADLALPGRGVTALFGASGSGKTSLLRLIAGLDRPVRGHIALDGDTLVDTASRRFVPAHRRQLGVVFQEARLFPHYRVSGNLTYGMPARMTSRFEAVVGLLGIDHLLARYPATLSGGEARRVAIGRALLSDPRLLLLDEPLTGLDGARKRELLRYIQRLAGEVEIPIVYVSHEPPSWSRSPIR